MTRKIVLPLALGGFALWCHAQSAGFRIAGQVVRMPDHRAVRRARVTISPVEQRGRFLSVVSGENGEFSFAGLPQGKYALAVSDHGRSQLFQQSENFSTAISAGPGLDSEHILFTLESQAVISGEVLDDENEPVQQASVFLFGGANREGRLRSGMLAHTISGTDGRFRFPHLPAGTYYVGVFGRPWYAQNALQAPGQPPQTAVKPELDVAYRLTYYGGGYAVDGAMPIKLQDGAKTDIQIVMRPLAAAQITLDEAENPERRASFSLSQAGPGGALINLPIGGGGAGIAGVPPGEYVLVANMNGTRGSPEARSQSISVAGNTTVHLGETMKTTVGGKVTFEGDLNAGMAVVLIGTATSDTQWAGVRADGSFQFANLAAGRYDLRLGGNLDGYVKKAAANGNSFSDGVLTVVQGAQIELKIDVARDAAKVDGVALKNGKPAAGAMVLLLPEDARYSNAIPRDQSDSDGTFGISRVAPGRYTLVAIDDGRGLSYADSGAMKGYRERGISLDVPMAKDAVARVEVQRRR